MLMSCRPVALSCIVLSIETEAERLRPRGEVTRSTRVGSSARFNPSQENTHLSAREWEHHSLAGFPSFCGVVGARRLRCYGLGVVVGVVDIEVVSALHLTDKKGYVPLNGPNRPHTHIRNRDPRVRVRFASGCHTAVSRIPVLRPSRRPSRIATMTSAKMTTESTPPTIPTIPPRVSGPPRQLTCVDRSKVVAW